MVPLLTEMSPLSGRQFPGWRNSRFHFKGGFLIVYAISCQRLAAIALRVSSTTRMEEGLWEMN